MLEVLFEGSRAIGVRVKPEDGSECEVRSKVVIDASGQSTLIIDRFGLPGAACHVMPRSC